MKTINKFCLLIFIVFSTGCGPQFIRMEKPNTPIERPTYTILSPHGDGWLFHEEDAASQHALFFHLLPKSTSHTIYANVIEVPSYAKFKTPDEFLSFIKNQEQVGFNYKRFSIIDEDMKLDNRFGDYSVLHYSKIEDHGAANPGKYPYLIMETYTYFFIHPHAKNLMIMTSYSERGGIDELDKDFKAKAILFMEGLRFKKGE
jgi:hypothetical protein